MTCPRETYGYSRKKRTCESVCCGYWMNLRGKGTGIVEWRDQIEGGMWAVGVHNAWDALQIATGREDIRHLSRRHRFRSRLPHQNLRHRIETLVLQSDGHNHGSRGGVLLEEKNAWKVCMGRRLRRFLTPRHGCEDEIIR